MVFVRFSQPFWAGAAVALPPGTSAKAIPAPATSATARVARRWFRSMADSFVTGAGRLRARTLATPRAAWTAARQPNL